jgi:hypothetical protein
MARFTQSAAASVFLAVVLAPAGAGAGADDHPASDTCKHVMNDAALSIWTLQPIGPRWALELARFSLTRGKAGIRKANQPSSFLCSDADTHSSAFAAIEGDFKQKEAIVLDGETKAGLKFLKADWGTIDVQGKAIDSQMRVHYADLQTNAEVSDQEARSRLKWNESPLRSWPTGAPGTSGATAGGAGVAAASMKPFPVVPNQAVGTTTMPFHVGSTWVGDYTCGNTKGALRIKIDHVSGSHVEGTADFNVAGLDGSYRVAGDYGMKVRSLDLVPGVWIHQPRGVQPIELDGTVGSTLRTFSGHVKDPSCSTFSTKL